MPTKAQEKFIIYVRTKQFWQYRFREGDAMNPVHIPMAEIKERFLPDPAKELQILVNTGLLEISYRDSIQGQRANLYKVVQAGGIDPSMLKPKGKALDPLTTQMKGMLHDVTLKPDAPSTLYFDTFLMLRNKYMDLFFSVDTFSGRIHTPITNFHRTHRPNILLQGQETTSLDVVTMQPLLLGKILKNEIGENDFSKWINSGKDIYLIIQEKANLMTRDEAKKRFFEILFSKPNNQLAALFGNTNWIEWINNFKRKPLQANPHTVEKNHSNLAWLLQTTEVQVMERVWQQLTSINVPFLSVHDEIIIKTTDLQRAEAVFVTVLDQEFEYYHLSEKVKTYAPPLTEPLANDSTQCDPFSWPESTLVENWNNDITALEIYFSSILLPTQPVRLNQCSTITDAPRFIESHLTMVKANNGKRLFLPYLNRLHELKQLLTSKPN